MLSASTVTPPAVTIAQVGGDDPFAVSVLALELALVVVVGKVTLASFLRIVVFGEGRTPCTITPRTAVTAAAVVLDCV